MKIFGFDIRLSRKANGGETVDSVLRRLMAADPAYSSVNVSPENCMRSTTVNAVVTAVSKRIASLPVKVYKQVKTDGEPARIRRELMPNHPVAKLLRMPNRWQDRTTLWLDAVSWLMRHGNLYFFKARGTTGPIRELVPLQPGGVEIEQDDNLDLTYKFAQQDGAPRTYKPEQIMHARLGARNGYKGNSPVLDVSEAIALEIAAEHMGGSIFGNSAMPSLVFKHGALSRGFKTEEEERKFIEDFQAVYSKTGRFKSMVVPFGMDVDSLDIDNEKSQFLATRQYQRTVIAGAWGVPPHLVGDLTGGTFNNVEQQSLDFTVNVVVPYVRILEAAMERSLLTDQDRRNGVIIRFNVDAALRGDFKTRQEGLNIQRQAGVINANDWREHENLNPISEEDGGEEYWRKGPSGQSAEPPASGNNNSSDTAADNSQAAVDARAKLTALKVSSSLKHTETLVKSAQNTGIENDDKA